MQPVHFEDVNFTFTAPPGMDNCEPLPVCRVSDGSASVSCWELSDADVEQILIERRIFVVHCGAGMQPLWLHASNPIIHE